MVLGKRIAPWLQVVLHIGALIPLLLLVIDFARDELTFDPIREITLRTGRYALTLLELSLACTPLHILSGVRWFNRARRPLGLYAFLYASLHFLTFIGLDFGFNLSLIVREMREKPFIQVGLGAFLILLVLAVTSIKSWMRRLGKNWKRVQRGAYLAGTLAVLHFLWLVKGDIRRPLIYGAVLLLLLILRIPPVRSAVVELRSRVAAGELSG